MDSEFPIVNQRILGLSFQILEPETFQALFDQTDTLFANLDVLGAEDSRTCSNPVGFLLFWWEPP